MSLVVVAYPEMAEADLVWIEAIRAGHDELHRDAVRAHFTLVFPTDAIAIEALIAHLLRCAASTPSFAFVLTSACVVDDASSDYWHTILVPSQGRSEIVSLHDRLYSGPLRSFLRADIPYIPHIGVGSSRNIRASQHLAGRLNAEGLAVRGRVTSLELASYDGRKVTTVQQAPLK